MIVVRTPLRLSFGGGATDLPSYADQYGGLVVGAALDLHTYCLATPSFHGDYFLRYIAEERAGSVESIRHPLVRAVLTRHPLPEPIELVSIADVPSGTGLGSSSAFLVGLLRLVDALTHATPRSPAAVAEEAAQIEQAVQGPIGRQDAYIAAYGGLRVYRFTADGTTSTPLALPANKQAVLARHLLLVDTGLRRSAPTVLADQHVRTLRGDTALVAHLHGRKAEAETAQRLLEAADFDGFGDLLDAQWQAKRERSPGITTPAIDAIYATLRRAGARGGRLLGAGGGGFFVAYAPDAMATRAALAAQGLRTIPVRFAPEGSTVLVDH